MQLHTVNPCVSRNVATLHQIFVFRWSTAGWLQAFFSGNYKDTDHHRYKPVFRQITKKMEILYVPLKMSKTRSRPSTGIQIVLRAAYI